MHKMLLDRASSIDYKPRPFEGARYSKKYKRWFVDIDTLEDLFKIMTKSQRGVLVTKRTKDHYMLTIVDDYLD